MVRLPVVISVFVCLAFHTSVISCQSTQGLLGLYTYLEMYILADSGILGSSEYPGNPGILRQRGRTSWDRPSIPGILGYSDSEVGGPRNVLESSKYPGYSDRKVIAQVVLWNILGLSEYPGNPWIHVLRVPAQVIPGTSWDHPSILGNPGILRHKGA